MIYLRLNPVLEILFIFVQLTFGYQTQIQISSGNFLSEHFFKILMAIFTIVGVFMLFALLGFDYIFEECISERNCHNGTNYQSRNGNDSSSLKVKTSLTGKKFSKRGSKISPSATGKRVTSSQTIRSKKAIKK